MAITWDQPVFSSMCQSIAYDDENNEMIVTWKNGSKGAYTGVDEETALQCSKAASVGNYIISEIKPNFPYRKL